MKQFEYKVTKHNDEEFAKFAYFCSDSGECGLDQIPTDQTRVFAELLNNEGAQGWELIQIFFQKGGVVIFWKRAL